MVNQTLPNTTITRIASDYKRYWNANSILVPTVVKKHLVQLIEQRLRKMKE